MKIRSIIVLALLAMFVSCNRQERLLKKYEAACDKGDKATAEKLLNEFKKKYPEAKWPQNIKGRIDDAQDILEEKTTPRQQVQYEHGAFDM